MSKFISSKHYGHGEGFTVAYRQHRAESHCRFIHGYSLAFDLEFHSDTLDARNWVVDFGSLRTFKEFLKDHFDHTLLVAVDDPEIETFKMLHSKGLCKMREIERTGCEGIAKFLSDYLNQIWLTDNYPQNESQAIVCHRVTVSETPSNSAAYEL